MRSQYHWPPREGDRVYQMSREHNELWPHGEIVAVIKDWSDPDASKVLVKYFRHANRVTMHGYTVLTYNNSMHWKIVGRTVYVDGEEIGQLDLSQFSYVYTGEEYTYGGCDDLKTYDYDAFEGNWSSSAGGNNRWEID